MKRYLENNIIRTMWKENRYVKVHYCNKISSLESIWDTIHISLPDSCKLFLDCSHSWNVSVQNCDWFMYWDWLG